MDSSQRRIFAQLDGDISAIFSDLVSGKADPGETRRRLRNFDGKLKALEAKLAGLTLQAGRAKSQTDCTAGQSAPSET